MTRQPDTASDTATDTGADTEAGAAGAAATAAVTVGVGAARGVPAEEVLALIREVLAGAGLGTGDVAALATVDAKRDEPGLRAAAGRLGVALHGFPAGALAAVAVPNPSETARAALGTPSVAEAAALLCTRGGHPELVVPKTRSVPRPGRPSLVTVAVARPGPHAPAPAEGTPAGSVTSPGTGPEAAPAACTGTGAGPHAASAEPDLRHHGDAEVRGAGLTDLAVNVRPGTPPRWLTARLADSLGELSHYPDGRAARRAVAARHGLPEECVLLTAGAAEAFVLLARAVPAAHPAVVHPQFTEPEAALRDAGHTVRRILLRERDGFRLAADDVPARADLVVVGNPTNPTSVLHPSATLAALAREGRTLVVDEAFIDAVPGERETLAPRTGALPGRVVVLRSLTKTWGLAGLRIGYLLSDPETVRLLARHQPLWPVSGPALTAAEACSTPGALAEAERAAVAFTGDRAHLLARLAEFGTLRAVGPAEAPFLLVHHPRADELRHRLRQLGFALRRGDTFPGLGPQWLRLAVRDRATTDRLAVALAEAGVT